MNSVLPKYNANDASVIIMGKPITNFGERGNIVNYSQMAENAAFIEGAVQLAAYLQYSAIEFSEALT